MSESRPVVSVLLLCHNEAVFIRRAIRSVLEQSLTQPVEIILMDDASSDGSAGIVTAEVAAAARPGFSLRVIRSETNLGNAGAFVTALEAAQGRYYHVLDGDDFWIDPDKLSRQVAILEAHPELAGVAHRTILRASEDGSESFHPQQDPPKQVLQLEDFLTGGLYFHTSAMLFRNRFRNPGTGQVTVPAILREVRGDMVRLFIHAAQGGIFYLAQTMSVYDDHRGGIWTGLDWPGRQRLLNRLYNQLSEHGYLSDMGEPAAAEYLAGRLAAIAAYAPTALRPISLHPDQVAGQPRQRLTEISRISGILDLETQLTALTAQGSHEDALRLVHRFLTAIGYDRNIARAARSRRLSCPEIDWHCAHIGGLIATRQNILPVAADPAEAAAGPVVLIVSGMAGAQDETWQTTREMIELWRGRAKLVIISTEILPSMADIQARVGPDVELLLNTQTSLVEKTAWLIWHVARLRPSRILVNPLRNDVAIMAGLRREHAPHIHLLGSYDTGYLPCVHSYALDGYVARRPYDMAWFHKLSPNRQILHLPRLLPAAAAPDPLTADRETVTATATLTADRAEGSYDYTLSMIVPLLLASGAQRHIHAGPLSAALLNRLRKEMIRRGIPAGAFVHLPDAATGGSGTGGDIGADLRAAGATLFLHGFPWPETGPLISAMAAGLPVLAHRNYLHPALSLADLCPPGTVEWWNGEHLEAILRGIGPDWLAAQSKAVSAHVAAHLSPGALLAGLGEGFMVPRDPATLPDLPVPETRQELRRLMSEIMEMTLFRA
ncbi:glycosyltransferase family 2 protein [Szabonella alba]|uniref:Glycosyltransferase family 2 protein n=1 Tax=Szabonella alba TaxID=2804194 RepID=A0A8K0VDX1_9RHOB|nr:glycosyltransferase family A protein [Szabonella alba]MBL4919326.1 glycosyltransferase family 2 protein [Szabonella alba]